MNEQSHLQEQLTRREMTQEQLFTFLDLFEGENLIIWLDGGWAVDALYGGQTRPHNDVDIAIQGKDVSQAREVLAQQGFAELPGGELWNFVLSNGRGQEIDFHVVDFDENGDGQYGPPEKQIAPYPASCFSGMGELGGRPIRCIGAQYLMESHSGYAVDADDWHDVKLLHERYGVPIPKDFEGWQD